MSKSTKDYNKINWSEHYYLDSSSPSGLRWNRDVYVGTGKMYLRYRIGDSVGSLTRDKNKAPTAWRTKLDGTSYLVHRIMWCLYYGSIDNSLVVDHINGNPLDNSVDNLKLTNQGGNSRNKKLCVLNKSGVVGVCRYESRGSLFCSAQWRTLDGKTRSKSFSISKHGDSEAFRLACEYRTAQIALLNENGANYTLRHGSA